MMSLIAIPATIVAGCVAMFVGFLKALRRAGSESRRRLVARSAVATWATFTVLTFALLLAALDILPHWVRGLGMAVAFAAGILSARRARRSTKRRHGFA